MKHKLGFICLVQNTTCADFAAGLVSLRELGSTRCFSGSTALMSTIYLSWLYTTMILLCTIVELTPPFSQLLHDIRCT